MKEFIYNLKNLISKYIYIIMPVVLAIAVLVTVLIAVGARHRREEERKQELAAAFTTDESVVEQIELEQNAYPDVNKLFTSYYNAMADGDTDAIESISTTLAEEEKIRIGVISQYIESYPLVDVYTKPGPVENSWVAFVYTKLKFVDHDWEVPGMQAMYVCTRDNGSLYINTDEEQDSNVTDYIQKVAVQDDVVDLNNKVAAEYNDLLASNEDLVTFLDQLSSDIDLQVGQQLGELLGADGEGGSSAIFLRATDSINVRAAASTDSEIVGQTVSGTTYPFLEDGGDGWSKIYYNGGEGYVKTEYFEAVDVNGESVDMANAKAPEPEETEAPAEENADAEAAEAEETSQTE